MGYVFLLLGIILMGGGLFFSARPVRTIDLRQANRCDTIGRYGTQITYQETCPMNRSTNSGGTAVRRSTGRSFRGGGPGAGK
jgi:hypothetical protein